MVLNITFREKFLSNIKRRGLLLQKFIRHNLFSHYGSFYPCRSPEGIPPFIGNSISWNIPVDAMNRTFQGLTNVMNHKSSTITCSLTYIQSRSLDAIMYFNVLFFIPSDRGFRRKQKIQWPKKNLTLLSDTPGREGCYKAVAFCTFLCVTQELWILWL